MKRGDIRELKRRRQATAAKTSPKKWIRAVSNFIALIPSTLMCQMLAIFQELNSKGLYLNSEKQKENRCLVFTRVVHKTWYYEVSLHSRTVIMTARKNTKKACCTCKVIVRNLLLFYRSRWRRRCRCLSALFLTQVIRDQRSEFQVKLWWRE